MCSFQPIRFVNLPNTRIVNEDDDLAYLVFVIITYDYNYYLHDNVTCDMSFIPYEDNLFELVHDGRYAYDCKYRQPAYIVTSFKRTSTLSTHLFWVAWLKYAANEPVLRSHLA